MLGVDGISDFNALHCRKYDHEVQFCAFDILAEGGDDLRKLPLHLRSVTVKDRHSKMVAQGQKASVPISASSRARPSNINNPPYPKTCEGGCPPPSLVVSEVRSKPRRERK